ncbi:YbaK/EbsC family protein [Anaeromicrobium sediminis]|uniref:Prolyl-tRNA editing protein n=1 Tax=Anaeromicrobium sediminis TaxID=1478221 RepID=A0A267MGN4_9FIRM|nr:YbaK/EbsC family protein [Anaeromicrobium sediminis]PAB58562.1 prolyl-tRNA editing protein [Anaeromicrobium sediminis]
MSIESVRHFFEERNLNYPIYELEESTATVELAANAHGVEPARIAKTLACHTKEDKIILVMCGDDKLDNKKFKNIFKCKCKFLNFDEVLEFTGHAVGGVCPFGLKTPMKIYLDERIKEFDYVLPAAGSSNSAVRITPEQLESITNATWVDVRK